MASVLLSGCAVGPDFVRPSPPRFDTYGAGTAPAVELGKPTDPTWWRQFGASSLDDLVAAGLKASPTLDSARNALLQIQNQARAGAGVFYPALDLSAAAARERISSAELGEAGQPRTIGLYTLTGAISYAVDLFGGARRKVESLKAAADQQRYQFGSAYLLLTGNIVEAAIARAGYAEEAKILGDIVDQDGAQRQILEAEFQAGQGAFTNVLQADQQLAADHQSLALARQRKATASHLINTLIGREPGEGNQPAPALADFHLPAGLPLSLPSQLVRQRPDILQAEAAMHEANAEVGVATAAMFPSISLTGDYGAAAASLGRLDRASAQFWGLGPSINLPIFQGGALGFGRQAARAGLLKAQADYRQTVLSALQQVADSLKALDADSAVADASRRGAGAAVLERDLITTNRDAGVLADTDAIAARIQAERARLVLVAAEAQQLQDFTALTIATGGGWAGQNGEGGVFIAAAK